MWDDSGEADCPADRRRSSNGGSLLARRLRRRANGEPTLGEYLGSARLGVIRRPREGFPGREPACTLTHLITKCPRPPQTFNIFLNLHSSNTNSPRKIAW